MSTRIEITLFDIYFRTIFKLRSACDADYLCVHILLLKALIDS